MIDYIICMWEREMLFIYFLAEEKKRIKKKSQNENFYQNKLIFVDSFME